MAIDVYYDFVIVADQVEKNASGAASKFTVTVFDSPVGQGEKKEIVVIPGDLIQQLRWLEERRLDDDLEAQIKLGEVIAGLLLPPYAREMFGKSLARLRDGQGLRLRLRLADELADFPWEYAYIQDAHGERTSSGFLALDPRVSIARHEAIALPGDWFEAPGSRRVVVAMASPSGHPRLENLAVEQDRLQQTLEAVEGVEPVFVPESLTSADGADQGATLQELVFALMERTDVFHFSGHGEFAAEMGPAFGSKIGKGGILLAKENNLPFAASAEQLAELLRGKGVRLVVLGACETGRRDGVNVWSGVAAALLKAGIPAVVAMQYKVKDTLAAAFSEAFYRALVAGFTVDEAVSLGRALMRIKAAEQQMTNNRDWGAPVLYLRAPSGVVFNPVNNTAAVKTAEEKLGDLFDFHARRVEASGRVVGAVVGGLQAEQVNVQQKVDEDLAGLMIGAVRYGQQGGRLVVKQELDTVSGVLIGGIVGGEGDQAGAMSQLQQLFQMGPTPKYCAKCGAALAADARFCGVCGTKVAS